MERIQTIPEGCIIEQIEEFDGRTYRWQAPKLGAARLIAPAFLCLWLCGWAVGLVSAVTQLQANHWQDGFLLLWLAGWTVGGIFASGMLFLFLRGPRPESVTLTEHVFRYDPGSVPLLALANAGDNPSLAQNAARAASPFSRRKPIELDRPDAGPFVLDRVGERQRLYFDHGADRVEIGMFLREPEREWLANVLAEWRER